MWDILKPWARNAKEHSQTLDAFWALTWVCPKGSVSPGVVWGSLGDSETFSESPQGQN